MQLVHKDSGFATSARIGDGGVFTLSGVRVGVYNVGFTQPGTAAAENLDPDAAMKQIEAGTYEEPPVTLPEAFLDPLQSGITVEVKEGDSQSDLQL